MKLDPTIWFQISGKYRTAARLPAGVTGIEALKTLNIREPEWAERMGEGHAGDHYLRCCNGEQKELTVEEWMVFKKAGGTTYMAYAYDIMKTRLQHFVAQLVREEIVDAVKADKLETALMRWLI